MTDYKHQFFGGQSYSQHGEDMCIVAMFHRLGITAPSYIDVGAHHPWELSNTALLYKRGSRGICVEANPHIIHKFWEERPRDRTELAAVVGDAKPGDKVKLHRASHSSGINSTVLENLAKHPHMDSVEVSAVTLSQIVEWYADGAWPDFLSLDAEGRDMEILHSIPENSQIKIICVEAISQMGDVSDQIRQWASERGYLPHSWMGGNAILALESLMEKLL